MRRRLTALALAAALTTGCDSPLDSGSAPSFAISTKLGVITLANGGDEPVYYFLVEREAQAYVDWIPCAKPDTCTGVAPGTAVRLGYNQIVGYDRGDREAVLTRYRLDRQADGSYKATDFHHTSIPLR
ncbi:hypothetical protein [Longimicrobium terrae]|uniref:Lipoprotein n=1 Tax=Longimicrobium terrae TaxID=1639882 RepID=A0A841GVH3_9BACT|nr:hypothetical protein [Longimicrobium terrae]MBB4634938.1 hypothetical protein [Longimicrobium terrae]MBB6069333.1 hypothetical protein [Longimicrobium terrae]NNC31859.1 hypothetical protein [Longimicrobium terrae]